MSAASGGNSEPKQGQRSQSARGFCPRSTMRVPQPDIIEHFGNADAVPQLPERCLSRKAGIVRYCPNCELQKLAPHAVRHLFVAVIASIISYASRVSTDILTNIMQASLRCCSRFSLPLFLPILLHFIQAFPLTYLHSHLLSQGQYRIILSADTASEVRQMPSQKRR